MKHLILVAALALAGCGGGGGGGSSGFPPSVAEPQQVTPTTDAPVTPAKPSGCRVALYGDSIMYGFGLTPRPVERLRQLRPNWTFTDRSLSGDTWHDGVPRMLQTVQDFDVGVLQWGINDAKVAFPLNEVTMAEQVMIARVKSIGAKAVVTGLINNSLPLGGAYDEKIRDTAITAGAAFASWGERSVSLRDGLHPDQEGSDQLMEDLVNTLDKECPQ